MLLLMIFLIVTFGFFALFMWGFHRNAPLAIEDLQICWCMTACICLIITLILVGAASHDVQKEYNRYEQERNQLSLSVQELSSSSSINERQSVYKAAVEFNEEVLSHKENCDNRWFGIYYNYKVAELDLIDLPVAAEVRI